MQITIAKKRWLFFVYPAVHPNLVHPNLVHPNLVPPQLILFVVHKKNKDECFLNTHLHLSGQGRIRTAEGASQQIYSLPVLTTYLPTQCALFCVTPAGFKPATF